MSAKADAMGWPLSFSSAATMRAAASASRPSNTSTATQAGRPSLSVPVLSNTTSVARASVSSASGRVASTPQRASAPCAAASTAGTDSDRAQGQLITSNASVTSNARSGWYIRQPA